MYLKQLTEVRRSNNQLCSDGKTSGSYCDVKLLENGGAEVVKHEADVNDLIHDGQIGDREIVIENPEALLDNSNEVLDPDTHRAELLVSVTLSVTLVTLGTVAWGARGDHFESSTARGCFSDLGDTCIVT